MDISNDDKQTSNESVQDSFKIHDLIIRKTAPPFFLNVQVGNELIEVLVEEPGKCTISQLGLLVEEGCKITLDIDVKVSHIKAENGAIKGKQKMVSKVCTNGQKLKAEFEIKEQVDQELDEELIRFLKSYEDPGEICRRDQRIQNDASIKEFKAIVQHIPTAPSCFDTPFVVICLSSGWGKTQLPFTLNIPCMYFLFRAANEQNIYKVYSEPSTKLNMLLTEDLNDYDQRALNIRSFDLEFESSVAGFLAAYWKSICQYKTDEATWMSTQAYINISSIKYQRKNIDEALAEIKNASQTIKGPASDLKLPSVFIDEANDLNSRELRFLRTIVRLLKLPIIFMGTNAVNLDHFRTTSGASRKSFYIDYPWCYLVHKLPPMSPDLLDQQLTPLRDMLPAKPGLFDMLSACLLLERPLFTVKAIQILSKHLSNPELAEDGRCELLDHVIAVLYREYVYDKSAESSTEFSEAQFCFMGPRSNKDEWPACFIHRHLASVCVRGSSDLDKFKAHIRLYLRVENPSDAQILENLQKRRKFKTVRSGQDVQNVQDNNKESVCYYNRTDGYRKFLGRSVMPDFKDYPITGLSFSGSMNAISATFVNGSRTAVRAVFEFYQNNKGQMQQTSGLDGRYLECVTEIALILSSHVQGLQNQAYDFRAMFPQLIRQFQYLWKGKAPVVDFDEHAETWAQFLDVLIPYCATSGAEWNEVMADCLVTNLNTRLGMVERNKKDVHDIFDVGMFEWPTHKKLLSVEGRMGKKPKAVSNKVQGQQTKSTDNKRKISSTLTNQKADENENFLADRMSKKLNENKAKIFVILATEWTQFNITSKAKKSKTDTKESRLSEILEKSNTWLVKLVKHLDQDPVKYRFEEWFKPNANVERVCILVDLAETLHSEELEQIKAFCKI